MKKLNKTIRVRHVFLFIFSILFILWEYYNISLFFSNDKNIFKDHGENVVSMAFGVIINATIIMLLISTQWNTKIIKL